MALNSTLYSALLSATGWSPATLSRKADQLRVAHGPMTADEARHIIAHERGIDLEKYDVPAQQIERVRTLRASGATLSHTSAPRTHSSAAVRPTRSGPSSEPSITSPPTPRTLFNSRSFHPAVVRSSRNRFVNGQRSDAIRAAFVAVNNRTRRMGNIRNEVDDGQALAGVAFSENSPILQMTDLATVPKIDEQVGLRFLAMAGIRGMRNPRSHADEEWWTDEDVGFVLECLAFASLLHRCLDHCQAYRQRSEAT